MPLLLDGKITIPLFHGTNLLFYDSIKEHGLGGRNPIKELRVIELLRDLVAICENSLPAEEDWMSRVQIADLIASQKVTGRDFNFRHGSVYLAASIEKAVRYAVSSEFSSEALAHFMMLRKRLLESGVDLPPNIEVGARAIVEFASGKKAPLVFQLDDLSIDGLCAEAGGDPTASLNFLESIASEDTVVFHCLLGCATFESHEVIPSSAAKVFSVLREPYNDSARSDGYSLVPFRRASSNDDPINGVVLRVNLS